MADEEVFVNGEMPTEVVLTEEFCKEEERDPLWDLEDRLYEEWRERKAMLEKEKQTPRVEA